MGRVDAEKKIGAPLRSLACASIAAGAAAAAYLIFRSAEKPRRSEAMPPPGARLLALMAAPAASRAPGMRTKSGACAGADARPDPACTPGAVFPQASARDICAEGYARGARNVSVSLKRQVYAAYGLDYPQAPGAYEVDHLIPLELGGSNDISNLFPQPAAPLPGFREKDLVENYLHEEMCGGEIALDAAQNQIAHDWIAVYDALTPDELAALRAQSAAWARSGAEPP